MQLGLAYRTQVQDDKALTCFEKIIAEFNYAHPIFDGEAIAAQHALPSIQGKRNTWFAGAWTGYGFHEDGHKSGLQVARAISERSLIA
jgi:predicted NAD/FAD-binding protein